MTMAKMTKNHQTPTKKPNPDNHAALPTFLDHVRELRGRLFWVAAAFLGSSALAYPFYDELISILTSPLHGQQLYYLTPVGGFSFILKICTYAGIVLTLPAITFHLYRYLQPVIGVRHFKITLLYTVASCILAAGGIAFAYFVSLPAALHFLTNFDLPQVTPMLTVDSYLTFVVTYLIGAAVLFQLPLIMLITNSVTPLPPRKLMSYQRHVILAAFVIAAVISPTPDAINQTLLALPVIVMYQVGIVAVWLRQRRQTQRRARRADVPSATAVNSINVTRMTPVSPIIGQPQGEIATDVRPVRSQLTRQPMTRVVSLDGLIGAPQLRTGPQPLAPPQSKPILPEPSRQPPLRVPQRPTHSYGRSSLRTIDGFMVAR
jgi:sec-independent protein translocase protein TatC